MASYIGTAVGEPKEVSISPFDRLSDSIESLNRQVLRVEDLIDRLVGPRPISPADSKAELKMVTPDGLVHRVDRDGSYVGLLAIRLSQAIDRVNDQL